MNAYQIQPICADYYASWWFFATFTLSGLLLVVPLVWRELRGK